MHDGDSTTRSRSERPLANPSARWPNPAKLATGGGMGKRGPALGGRVGGA